MKALAVGLVFPLPLLLPMSTLAPPQALAPPNSPEFNQRSGLPNGRLWSKITEGEKSSWLLGFSNGIFVVEAIMHPTAATEQSPLEKVLSTLYESKLTLGEKIQGLNHFYQDVPENAPIAIPEALQYVTVKANGATQSQLDDLVSGLRKASAQ